jgi:pimeloyl-[acyl-carrier protein] methyl ester esterase
MIISWLHRHHRDRLVIFCNGWGMDGTPFSHLQAHSLDVLMCCNFAEPSLHHDLLNAMDGYPEVSLIAWSMGVWAGQYLFSGIPQRFTKNIAINGTLCPIHDLYGIPVELFAATLAGFNAASRLKFYRRMCGGRDILERFLAHQPIRQIDDQREELEYLMGKTDCSPTGNSIYTDIVIADKDRIMPTENQQRFWQSAKIHVVDGSHFLFYGWDSWDTLLQDPGKSGEASC